MCMILVIIILVAWMIILGPNLLKRRARTVGGINSISHFHRQLRILEQSGPEPVVTPAFRLRSVDGSFLGTDGGGGSGAPVVPKLSVVGADQLPRPALAFLGRDPHEADAGPTDHRSVAATSYGPVTESRDTDPDPLGPSARLPDAYARYRVRRRRRDTLGILTMVFVSTVLIGFIPGGTAAWALSLVSGLALAAYVALLVRMRQMAEERERKLHYLRPAGSRGFDDVQGSYPVLRSASDSGVSDPAARISGRYAHPSNQAAVAR
jgi:hypothetical protein